MTAHAAGLAQHPIGMKATSAARSAAKPRNGAKQCLTAEENRRTNKVTSTGECPFEKQM
jgi:hypothetical protein